jgi:uncharacterized membrane protein
MAEKALLNQSISVEPVGQFWNAEIHNIVLDFIRAPMENPDMLPSVLPLIMGAVIMELYFGKHKKESLGWNTSVGNAVIWMATGISLLMSETLTQPELYATYALIGLGGFVTFMDFFHIWPSTVAFVVSSSGLVYTLAYTLVLVIKTSSPMTRETLAAAAIFFVGLNVVFKLIQHMEDDSDGFATDL